MEAGLSEAGLRHFRVLSSPGGEIVLNSRLLFHSFFLALAVVVFGCSKSDETPCPRPEPAFRLQITAEKGPLPDHTFLRVFYQGKYLKDARVPPHEDYDTRNPPASNVDVCCRTGAPVEGKLPSVPCGLPIRVDASVKRDAALVAEAGSDASNRGPRDAASRSGDAASDGAVESEGGSKGEAPEALLCDLWTNGPADIVLTGVSYPQLRKSLLVEFDECGIARRDVRVIWSRLDGGP